MSTPFAGVEFTASVTRGGWPELLRKREEEERLRERLAIRYGALSMPAVVRRTSHAPQFVHCHECRWPVNPGRTQLWIGPGKFGEAMPATEAQMQRTCEGLRRMENA